MQRTALKSMTSIVIILFLISAGCQSKDSPIEAKAPTTKTIPPLPLKVKGNQVLNSKNQPVLLRGVDAACLEWTCDCNGQILETIRVAIDDWNSNIIRLPLAQDRWFGKAPEQEDGGKAYRALVKEIVDLCSSKGCYIMLDLHWSDVNEWGQNIGQHSMPDRNSLIFWKDFAAVFANNPAVLFDLYNEPHDVSWDVWLNGGMITDRPNRPNMPTKKYEAVGMQELLNTVRSTGAKNVIVAGGLDWAYDFNGILAGRELKDPTGNGVIYANHAYDNKQESVFTWITSMEEATAKFPVIISEFGGSGGPHRRTGWWGQSPSTAIGDDWLLHVLQAIQDHNWSFTAWDLHPTAGPVLISDWNYTPTPDFGVYVKELLVTGKLQKYTPPDLAKINESLKSPLPESARMDGKELYGDWMIKADPCDRQGNSILSFGGNNEGRLIGQWINARGFTELEDIRFKDNSVTFTQTVRFRKETYKGYFAGTIEGDKLSGTLTHGGNQSKLEAKRSPAMPLAAGTWELNYKVNEHDIKATLPIKADKDGKLTASWQSSMGEHQIQDLNCSGDKINIKRHSKINDMDFNSTIEGTIQPKTDTITGIIKSDLGEEIPFEGKRMGSELIGTWILDVAAPWGNSRQRLKINPDLSGMYGTTPIDKIAFQDGKVTFKIAPSFGRMRFEMDFEGKIDGAKLTGEFKNPRGSQTVTGKKIG